MTDNNDEQNIDAYLGTQYESAISPVPAYYDTIDEELFFLGCGAEILSNAMVYLSSKPIKEFGDIIAIAHMEPLHEEILKILL